MKQANKLLLCIIVIACGTAMVVHAYRENDPFYNLLRQINRMMHRPQPRFRISQRRPLYPRYPRTHMSFFNDPFFNDPFFTDPSSLLKHFFDDDDDCTTYIIQTGDDQGQQPQEGDQPEGDQKPQGPNQNPGQKAGPQPRVHRRRYVLNGSRPTSFNGFFPLNGGMNGQADPRFGFNQPGQQQYNQYNPEDEKNKKTFKDVLGQKSAIQEVSQVVDFLKNPKKYHELGAQIPKGILLEGPPGCGKTLLAQAVAGEAGCTFIHTTGSSFINKYVGTGADNLRKLFDQARGQAPAIIFIDEIDAIGSREGDENQEYRNTINQLLSLMDGFQKEDNIIVMAATNFVKNLDSALTRPGRFDRKIKVGLPNKKGRTDILRYYFEKIKLAPSTNADTLAQEFASRTPGFSGADCKKLANEAALEACAQNATEITKHHCELAYDKVTLGLKNNFDRTKEQLWKTAVHEAGHAYVKRKKGEKVPKVTILSRGDALGATFSEEKYETLSDYQREELVDKIMALQAGAAAEKVILNCRRPGASGDYQQAYAIASMMVREFGMGEGDLDGLRYDKNMSEAWKAKFDQEIANLIQTSRLETEKFIAENKSMVEKLAKELHKKETMTEQEIDKVIG